MASMLQEDFETRDPIEHARKADVAYISVSMARAKYHPCVKENPKPEGNKGHPNFVYETFFRIIMITFSSKLHHRIFIL
jgi:hypothetical protein